MGVLLKWEVSNSRLSGDKVVQTGLKRQAILHYDDFKSGVALITN